MKTVLTFISTAALLFALLVGCSEPEKSAEPEVVVAEQPAEPALGVAPRSAPEPVQEAEPAVPKEEIEKAARFYALLHDSMSDEEKLKSVDAMMETNGWTEESYQALLYDIAQDPPSRAAYLAMTDASR